MLVAKLKTSAARERTRRLHFRRSESLKRTGRAVSDFARPSHLDAQPRKIAEIVDRALASVQAERRTRKPGSSVITPLIA
jgi:hypothetical protein